MAPYNISSNEQQLVHSLLIKGCLLERDGVTRIDLIDALEFAGAMFLGHEQPQVPKDILLGFQYCRRALTLRQMDTEDCRPIYKTPLKSKNGKLSEWSTLDDLQRMEQQPAQRKIQSFLVRLRILSSIGWCAVRYHFIPLFVDFFRMELPHAGSISEILDLIWSTVDTILRSERPHERSVLRFVENIVHALFANFNELPKDNPKLNSENLAIFVDLILMTDPLHMTDLRFEAPVVKNRQMMMLTLIFRILSRRPELISEEIRLALLQIVGRDGRDPSGFNLLHSACLILDVHHLTALSIIRLLVKLGADRNAVTNAGYGVFHILAQQPASETRDVTARLLVELGAHLDMANREGITAADLWFQKNTPGTKNVADLPDWLQQGVPKLMCLSSRVVRRHKLPYGDGAILPAVLIPLVSLH